MTGNTHNAPPVSVELDDAAAVLLNAMMDAFETRLAEPDMTASEATAMINFLRETGSLGTVVKDPKEASDA